MSATLRRRPAVPPAEPTATWAARLSLGSPWAQPAGVAVVLVMSVVGSVAEAYPARHYAGLHLPGHPRALAFALIAVAAAALWWRRSRPATTYVVAAGGVAAWAALGQVYGAALVVLLVATYSLAAADWQRRRLLVLLVVAGTSAVFTAGGLRGSWGWLGGPQVLIWPEMLAAGALGTAVSARRAWRTSVALQEAQLARTQEDETRRRVDAERLRIARELHDVVAHSMAMINLQAGAATVLLADRKGAEAADALEAIRHASKQGLRELRAILSVLRQVDSDGPDVALPDCPAFAALAAAATAAGSPTELRVDADLAAFPPAAVLAGYRIVQESLTNAVRHAPEAKVTVAISASGRMLRVEVSNEGSGKPPAGGGSGSGLTGMAERVAALGGTLRAGPTGGGSWSVHAELPVEPASGGAAGPIGLAGADGATEASGAGAAVRS